MCALVLCNFWILKIGQRRVQILYISKHGAFMCVLIFYANFRDGTREAFPKIVPIVVLLGELVEDDEVRERRANQLLKVKFEKFEK